ncbi:MAG TPA: T9SS type A sorting domain-containing protein [Bacteroidia bacterium]|nr:T9SS type A sorting domain-containing protein [Bacteroidia bacterium]HNU33228.1 T9SS type A sorting domain-containing protein [Bacteroidia bacterium]
MLRFILRFYVLFLVCSFQVVNAQNINTCSGSTGGVNFVGAINGYVQPVNCAVGDYRVLNYRRISVNAGNPTDGRGQWKNTINVQISGGNVTPLNMPGGAGNGFLFTNGANCGSIGTYARKWAFTGVGQGAVDAVTGSTYFTVGGNDMGLNMSATGFYTFTLQDAGCVNANYYVGRTTNNPVLITHTGAAQRVVNNDGSVTISFTLSATPSVEENFFVRYRGNTNDFSAGTSLAQATIVGTTGTVTIPTQVGASTVNYYLFSSTRTLAQLNTHTESDRSLATLNFADNAGVNFTYASAILVNGTTPASSALYATFTVSPGAFSAINAGTHRGVLTATVLGDVTTETGNISLLASGGTSNYSSLTINPSGNRLVQGNAASQMIDINGADFVTINGLNAGGNSLIIDNTNAAASNGTIRFINDAQNNVVRNCTIKGSSVAANAGVVFFSSAAGTNGGNDNITVENNVIRESSNGDPIFGIVSFGTSGAPQSKWNSNNAVLNNQLVNCFYASATICGGIHLTNGANENWTISGNSIYWTNTKNTVAAFDYWYGIRITGSNGTGFNITNNYIGGTSANCSGTPMSFASTSNGNKLVGMQLLVSSVVGSANVQGNTIANIVLNSNSSKSTSPYLFSGINVESGNVLIGTASPNIIGSSTATGSIVVNVASNAGGVVAGIANNTALSNCSIANNFISGISLTNAPVISTARVSFYGVYINGGTATVTDNIIGSSTIANSILNSTGNLAGANGFYTMGIFQANVTGSAAVIRNNTISNVAYNGSTNALAHQVIGIRTSIYSNIVSGNSISNLFTNAPNVNIGLTSSLLGISTTSTGADSIAQNQIFNLENTNIVSGSVYAGGIHINTGIHSVHRNLIYGIKINSLGNTGLIEGIRVVSGSPSIANNMICLGSTITTVHANISGIYVFGGSPRICFNSIALSGNESAASPPYGSAYCLRFEGGGSVQVVNNIFYNNRNVPNAASACLYFLGITQFNNVTLCDYNNFYFGISIRVAFIGAAAYNTLVAWQATTRDANSVSFLPVFANVANDLHITSGCDLSKRGTALSITVDYDGQTRTNPPDIGADEFSGTVTSVTWTGAVNTNWHVAANWCPAVVPTTTIDAIIPNTAVPNQPLIDLGGNAVCKSLTIGTGKTLTMASSRLLQVHGLLFTNNGTFNAGGISETVEFMGAVTINGTSATTFNNCIINNSTTLVAGVRPTMVGIFTLNLGSFVNIPPNYGASSRLNYNTTGAYNVNAEWTGAAVTAGVGNPNDVSISNNTTLNMPNIPRGLAGTMYITNGTLQMNATSGADLYVGRDWQRTGVSGTFNPNQRAIWFKGSADQTVRVMGNGTEIFDYLIIDKPLAGTYLKPSNAAGELTNITVKATAGDVFQIINNGSLDINGRTFALDGNNSISTTGFIYVNGVRTIINSDPGGINAGSFDITGTNNINQPSYFTKSVRNNSGTGSLIFNQNVLVTLADGRMDFGFDGITNLTTVQGVLQINLGGSVSPNSCYYSGPVPASTLRFANTIDYQVNATDKTWAAGAIYSGLPGIPWNVEVNNTNTDLTINDVRALRNNLSITDGRFTLLAGPFTIGGNWTRTNPAGVTVPPCAFIPNTNLVVFDKTGAGDQIITCTVNGNTETYYDLEISPATVNVQLSAGTNVDVVNELVLTSGSVDLNTNMLTLGTVGFAGTLTGGSTASYIIGYKAAVNGTFKRYIPATGSYLFPLGDLINYTPYNLNLTSATFSNSFINSSLYDLPHPNLGTATTYISRYWKIEPTGIIAPVFNTTYTYADADVVGAETGLYPFRYLTAWMGSGGSGAAFMQGTGSVNAGSNVLTWNNMNSFGDFTGLGNGSPLPISLLNFSASLKENDGIINWITANEFNNDFFTLERSWDSKKFEPVNIQKGAGTSNTQLNYSFLDKDVSLSGNNVAYYRLKQTDFNGAFSYSKIIALPLSNRESVTVLGCYPNPFNSYFDVVVISDKEYNVSLQLFNKHGAKVTDIQTDFKKGENKISLNNLHSLADGVYFLRLSSESFIEHVKLSKQ